MHRFKITCLMWKKQNRVCNLDVWGAMKSPNSPKKKGCHFIPHSTLGKAREIRVGGRSVISIPFNILLKRIICKRP